MTEPNANPGLWLRFRMVTEYERPPAPPKTETGKYKAEFISFSGADIICEVCKGSKEDPEVIGILGNAQGVKIGLSVDDITTQAEVTLLCLDNPFVEGGLIIR